MIGFHCAALYGAEMIGIVPGRLHSLIEQHQDLDVHVTNFEKLYGRDAKVRIKRGYLLKTRDGRGISYREFSVLCAIYSAIGDKGLARVTRDQIQRRSLGYRAASIMQAELSRRADKAQGLTERQLRDTVASLHRNKFFARCTVGRRITYFSNRLDGDALRKKILERRTYRARFHASQARKD